jgi:anti-anti-sigma factor
VNEARVDVMGESDRVCIDVSGDVDLANASDVEAGITAAIPNHATTVDLDLSNVTYLDSAGLQVVFALTVKLRRLQIDLRIISPPGTPARHAIDMAGLGSVAHIDPSG